MPHRLPDANLGHIIPAQPGYKVLLGRHHYHDISTIYLWYELEDVIAWSLDRIGHLSPITVKHGLIDRSLDTVNAARYRYHGIVGPDGRVTNIRGTFANIEDYRRSLEKEAYDNRKAEEAYG